jgi:hypothetical protein
VWGLKGRYDEARQPADPDKAHLNELSRDLYRQEVEKLLESISKFLPAGEEPLRAPDLRFHRSIGEFAGQSYSVTGELLSPERYQAHLAETLPADEEKTFIRDLMKETGWIAPREAVTG